MVFIDDHEQLLHPCADSPDWHGAVHHAKGVSCRAPVESFLCESPSFRTRLHHSSFLTSREAQEMSDAAEQVKMGGNNAEDVAMESLRMAIQAANDAISAAEVALWTEAIGFGGAICGLMNSYYGYHMDEEEVPEECRVENDPMAALA
eukprot:gnl/MRDRNA2_/MRDRNA2_122744_c0_seq1.p1 gnl/MRDRNA2_/MRDRNA2_122744_c0~~gnl/MRDRNA2_/MRDRNA2_122744_c0_seq1.p1  ORF type:complete len:168 (-),score=40.20 gnl/MRDRNA2_/MRDRNA2_122744_c0_seq1:87-530(-)